MLLQLYQTRQICLAVLHGAGELPVYVKSAAAEHRILPSSLRATPFPSQTWNISLSHSQSTSQHCLHYVRLIPSALDILFHHFFLILNHIYALWQNVRPVHSFPSLSQSSSTPPVQHPRSYSSTELTNLCCEHRQG